MPRDTVNLPSHSIYFVFTREDMARMEQRAKNHIVGAFDRATEQHRGKQRSTDNSIINVGPQRQHLLEYILADLSRPLVGADDLPKYLPWPFTNLSDRQREELASEVQRQAFDKAVQAVCRQRIVWYDRRDKRWNIRQSALDARYESQPGPKRKQLPQKRCTPTGMPHPVYAK